MQGPCAPAESSPSLISEIRLHGRALVRSRHLPDNECWTVTLCHRAAVTLRSRGLTGVFVDWLASCKIIKLCPVFKGFTFWTTFVDRISSDHLKSLTEKTFRDDQNSCIKVFFCEFCFFLHWSYMTNVINKLLKPMDTSSPATIHQTTSARGLTRFEARERLSIRALDTVLIGGV